jgi:GNAT superfamily N-acetyltransferase
MREGDLRRFRYDDSYEETVSLSDGQRVHLRPIRPSDKDLLREGFERLSPDSRYARFMAPKARLTDRELDYLTNFDGVNHFAMGAVRRHLVSKPEGVGSARFVRLQDKPDTAEPAITVADDYQGKGLGSLLLQRLVEAAWERDVRWFCTELLAENTVSKHMFESLSPVVDFHPAGNGALTAMIPLSEPDRTPMGLGVSSGTPVQRILSYVARATVSMRPRVTRAPDLPA